MTRAEAARVALVQTIEAAALAEGSVLPDKVYRNEHLERAFDEGNQGKFLNLVDGSISSIEEELGADGDGEKEFEVEVRFELVVTDGIADRREAIFDECLKTIGAAIDADRTLGGKVEDVRFDPPVLSELSLSGVPSMKPGEVSAWLLVTAPTFLS